MLTRAGVARRLRKSKATVRRLQAAGDLNPEQDWRGVYVFDEDEVEYVRERLEIEGSLPAAHSPWFAYDRHYAPRERPPSTPRPSPPTDAQKPDDGSMRRLECEVADLRSRLDVIRHALGIWQDVGPIDEVYETIEAAISD